MKITGVTAQKSSHDISRAHDVGHDMYRPDVRAKRRPVLVTIPAERSGIRRASGELTASELGLVALVAEGYSDKEVALRSRYTEYSVKQMLHRIYQKLDFDNGWGNPRVRLVLFHFRRFEEPAGDIPLTPSRAVQ